jgi:hypothetical protein
LAKVEDHIPPHSLFSGHNPKVDEVIKDSITDEEADRTQRHLKLERGTKLKFTFGAFSDT